MLFLADESCDAIIVRTLRALNHDVIYIAEAARQATDDDILHQALREQRILITEDKDFSQLVFRDRRPSFGIILVRIPAVQRQRKDDRISMLVNNHAEELIRAITTLTIDHIKIRPLPED